MKITVDFQTREVQLSMYHAGVKAVMNVDPMTAKLIGETLIANANKLLEMERRDRDEE